MGLLALWNNTEERSLLMKIFFADIILQWMRVLTCVDCRKTSQQNCILHGSFFVFLYIITVGSSSLSYAFQQVQGCRILRSADELSAPVYTPGGWYIWSPV